jgi:hypothetical protein
MNQAPVAQLFNVSGCDLWGMCSFLCGNQRLSVAIDDALLFPSPGWRPGW